MVKENEDKNNNSASKEAESSKQAREIKTTIKSLEKELDGIQSSCPHKEYEIKNCQTEARGFALRRVCKTCEKEIGYPSQEEIDLWASK